MTEENNSNQEKQEEKNRETEEQRQDSSSEEKQNKESEQSESKSKDNTPDFSPEQKNYINELMQTRLNRERGKIRQEEKTRLQKEAEEKQLLEENKFQELAERREQEALEAKHQLEHYQRMEKVNALLDKREVVHPKLRRLFASVRDDDGSPLELEDLNQFITDFDSWKLELVESEVKHRLESDTPEGSGESAVPKDVDPSKMSIKEKSDFINKYGSDEWEKILRSKARS